MHPADAAARGIKHGDIVSIYNERGTVLAGAYVTERVMPGAVGIDHGAKYDPIVPGEIDRGGAINTIVPRNVTSKNACGMAVSRLPGGSGEGRLGGAAGQVSRGVRPGVPHHRRPLHGRIYGEGGCLMGKVMVIDLAICNGCHNCQIACKDEHVGNDWTRSPNPSPTPASSGTRSSIWSGAPFPKSR